ncbi:hypothetical protein H696_03724 [Fonticula alba]|uniref:Arrestin C-terminal-like domain-containing protein n=1 Tax=Fonticula alba TaxID=691883 RepID=A0A058Z4T9_FONAL|nr:hypothetical protein H696_03724 [Fonticula alba]KCV69290.1 hypothetical protein H696_03724 [Fonticula alba]|eukprot:XP_009495855.1 hypothetical protein H696_03724 [Fonticula alba]
MFRAFAAAFFHDGSSIRLTVDKPYYVSGETIQGTAELDARSFLHTHTISIRWHGYERSFIREMSGTVNSEHPRSLLRNEIQIGNHYYRLHSSRHSFFDQTIVIAHPSGGLQPGLHVFPFTFTLPQGLPGVFFTRGTGSFEERYSAAISYEAIVTAEGNHPRFQDTSSIIINENIVRQIAPVNVKVDKSFIFSSKRLYMDATLPKSVYSPGETLSAVVKVNNESKRRVDKLKVILFRTVTICAGSARKTITTEIYRNVFNTPIEPASTASADLTFTVPESVQGTASGNLITSNYTITVECDIKMAFDLVARVPVAIALLPIPSATAPPDYSYVYSGMADATWE